MKQILPIIFFCLYTFTLIAQKKDISNIPIVLDKNGRMECGTPTPLPEIAQQQEKLMQQFIQRGTNLASPVSIPIKAHIVRKSDGTGGLATNVLNDAIANMNVKYATLKMSFYLCGGIHYIDSDAFYDTDVAKENDLLVLNNVNDAVNIYFVGNLVSGTSGLNGISAFPSANPMENRIVMWNNATSNGVTLPHEMGHYWNLYHTHETFLGAELVNGSNCSTKGDLVCDTPADPCCYYYNDATCTYTGTGVDANGQAYNPMINNLMSYYGLCRDIFTAGQYTRMDAGYALRMSYTGPNSYTFACNALGAAPTNLILLQSDCSVTLQWNDNSNVEMGYIIESSISPSGPFEAIGRVPANTNTYVDGRSLTTGITYYYRVVAANSSATYSNTASKLVNWNTNCYCLPETQSCGEGVQISNVTIKQGSTTLLDNTSSCAAVNGYSYPHTTVPNLPRNNTFSLSVSNPNYYLMGATAWMDFDHSGTFDADEIIMTKLNSGWVTVIVNFTVPNDAVEGLTRMRVRGSYNSNVPGPCNKVSAYGETEDYLVYIGCNLVSVTTIGGNRCGTGTVNLTASGCAGGTINWYSSLTGGASLGTGAAFTTPSISATGTYYAGCTLASCSSTRTPAVATVVDPTVEENSASRCGPGTLTLTATGCAGGTINWYAASSGGSVIATGGSFTTPSLSNSRTYFVACTIGSCTGNLYPVLALVNPIPAAPNTTGASRCNPGPLTLTASGCPNGTLFWYATLTGGNSFTSGGTFSTPTLGTTTTYYVECSANNCPSLRTSVTATIISLSAPSGTGSSRCNPGTLTLIATGCSGGTINWYAASSGGSVISTGGTFTTPSLSNSRTYYAGCVSGQCTSSLTPVTATVNSTPVATGASRCGAGSVTLTATGCAGGSTIKWYTVATGGGTVGTGGSFITPSLSTNTTYYVACASATCESARAAVVATININISFANIGQSAGTYRASQTITSAANVATGTNYYAGKAIILTPGFQAGNSEVFIASIQDCP